MFIALLSLTHCLQTTWSLDPHTADYIADQWDSAISQEFIEKSEAISLNFSHPTISLPPKEDGIYQAPEHHLVIFENPYTRVLYGVTQPNEREPFHLHANNSLLVVTQPTTFLVEYANGTSEVFPCPIGVYFLPGGEYYSCTNIGTSADECYRFEIKSPGGQ